MTLLSARGLHLGIEELERPAGRIDVDGLLAEPRTTERCGRRGKRGKRD